MSIENILEDILSLQREDVIDECLVEQGQDGKYNVNIKVDSDHKRSIVADKLSEYNDDVNIFISVKP